MVLVQQLSAVQLFSIALQTRTKISAIFRIARQRELSFHRLSHAQLADTIDHISGKFDDLSVARSLRNAMDAKVFIE